MQKILCICFSATYQRSILFDQVQLEKVNRTDNYGLYASGKAVNSARILAQLEEGCAVTICPLGKENAEDFVKLCEKDKLNLFYVPVPGKIRECWTLLDKKAATTTELVVNEKPSENQDDGNAEIKLLKLINEKLPEVDGVILAGSRQGKWSSDIYPTIAGMSEDAGKIFLADYLGNDLVQTIKTCPSAIIKINDEEFAKTFMTAEAFAKWDSETAAVKESSLKELLIQKSKEIPNLLIITRGTEPTFAAKDGKFSECATEKLTPVNTTACGDSFNAGFLYEYLKEKDVEKALAKGTWCAARNAENMAPGSIF